MEGQPIVIEQVFDADAKTVWRALTDKNEMKKWYFDLADFKAEPGFCFQFMGGTPEHQYLHLCEVTEIVPEKLLTYSWRYDGYEGISYVSFELLEMGEKVKLRLVHKGLETFPQTNPDFDKNNFVAGWNHIIGISLKEYVDRI